MTSLLAVQRSIRRALQSPLHVQAKAAGLVDSNDNPLIQWTGVPLSFVPNAHPAWLAAEIIFGEVVVHEIGKTPQVEGPGTINVIVRTPLAAGQDANDELLGIIVSAYPYASTPSFNGVAVNIDKSQHRGYGRDEPWLTGQVSVDWNIYQRI